MEWLRLWPIFVRTQSNSYFSFSSIKFLFATIQCKRTYVQWQHKGSRSINARSTGEEQRRRERHRHCPLIRKWIQTKEPLAAVFMIILLRTFHPTLWNTVEDRGNEDEERKRDTRNRSHRKRQNIFKTEKQLRECVPNMEIREYYSCCECVSHLQIRICGIVSRIPSCHKQSHLSTGDNYQFNNPSTNQS